MANAIAPATGRAFATVKDLLSDRAVQAQLAKALPKDMDAARMMRIAITATERNPALKDCEPRSVGLSILRAAEFGMAVDGWEGHLVPFKEKGRLKCQFIPDYKGLARLAYQSQLVLELHAEVICEGDFFEWEKGTDTFLRWKPAADGERGQMIGAWAGAKIRGGGFPFVVLTKADVMRHRACSTSKDSPYSPWNRPDTEPAMWRKTALRELFKILPRSTQLAEVMKAEDADETGRDYVDGAVVDVLSATPDEPPQRPKADRIAEAYEAKRGQTEPEPEPSQPEQSTQTTSDAEQSPDLDAIEDQYRQQIAEATTLAELASIELHATNNPAVRGTDARSRVITECAKARDKIRGARGQATNKPPTAAGQLFNKSPNAQGN